MRKRKGSGASRTWLRISLSLLLSGSMLMGPGACGADALKVGDYRTVTQDLGNERTVVSPDVTQTNDPKTGVMTLSRKRDKIREALKLTQQYQLVGNQVSNQPVDVYTVDTTKIPKKGDAYKGGTVKDIQTTRDGTAHKTLVSVTYDTTEDIYIGGNNLLPKKNDVSYAVDSTKIPKIGDAYGGGTVTDAQHNDSTHRTLVTVRKDATQDIYTASTTGIPQKGDAYNGGTVTEVTTTHDDVKRETSATVKYDATQDVYTASTTGLPQKGDASYAASSTGIPKKGDAFNGGKVTDVAIGYNESAHLTNVLVSYDVVQDVYTPSTKGIPKVGDAYNGGTVYSVVNSQDGNQTNATVVTTKTEDVYTASTVGIPKQGDSYGGGTVTSVTTTHDDAKHETIATINYDTTPKAYTASSAIPKDGDAFELTVTDVKKIYNPTAKKTVVDVTYTVKLPKFGISWSATSGTAYLEDIVAGGRLRIHQVGDTCSGKLSYCWSKHDDVAHQTNVGGMIIGAVGGTPFIYDGLVGNVAVPDTYSAPKTATVTVADVKSSNTISSSATLTVDPIKSTKTVSNTAWLNVDYLTTTVTDVSTTHDDAKHETKAIVTYEATQPPVYTVGDLTAIPKEGDASGGGTVWKVLTTHDDVKHQTNATVWWKKTVAYAVDTNLIPLKGDPYDVVVTDVKSKYDAATKKTQVDVIYSVQLNGAAYSYSNSFMKSFTKEDEIAAGYKLPAVGDKYSGTTANGFNTHNDVTHQTYINPVFTVRLPGTRAITSRVYAYVADYNTEGGVKVFVVDDTKSIKTTSDTATMTVADAKSTETASNTATVTAADTKSAKLTSTTQTITVLDTKSTVTSVTTTHDGAKHQTTAIVTYNTSTTTKTVTVPDTKSTKIVSNTFVFDVADTKTVQQVPTSVPVYDWVTTKSDPTSTVTTDYVSAGFTVASTNAVMMPTSISSGGGSSNFLSDRSQDGRKISLEGARVRILMKSDHAKVSISKGKAIRLDEASRSVKTGEDKDDKDKENKEKNKDNQNSGSSHHQHD